MRPPVDETSLLCTFCGQHESKYPATSDWDKDNFAINPHDTRVYHKNCLNTMPQFKNSSKDFLYFRKGGYFSKSLRIVVLGESASGKTDFVRRFVEERYISPNFSTIGVNMEVKHVNANGIQCQLQIFEFQSLRFRYPQSLNLSKTYSEHADAFIVIHDFTTYGIESVHFYEEVINHYTDRNVPKAICITKCDEKDMCKELSDKFLQECRDAEEFAKEKGWYVFKTSAKNNVEVEESFMTLADDCVEEWLAKYSLSPTQTFPYVCPLDDIQMPTYYQNGEQNDAETAIDFPQNTTALVDEFLGLEHVLSNNNTTFLCFPERLEAHQDFYKKLLAYLNLSTALPVGEDKVLKEVLQLSWMRIAAMKEHVENFSAVSDLTNFAKVITQMLQMFRESQRKIGIRNHSKHYFDSMETKITEAKQCIDKHLIGVADQVEKQLAMVESRAIFEFQAYHKAAKIKAVFRCLHVILETLALLPKIFAVVDDEALPIHPVKLGVHGVAFLVGLIGPEMESPKAFHCNFIDNRNLLLQNTEVMLTRQIGALENAIGQNPTLETLSSFKSNMMEIKDKLSSGEISNKEELELLKKLDATLDDIYAEIQKIKSNSENDRNVLQILDELHLQLCVAETDTILYSGSKSMWWDVFARIFTRKQRRIEQRQQSFSRKFVPMVNKLVSMTRVHFEVVAGESQAKMMTTEWKMESILKGVKAHLESFVKGMRAEGAVVSCITRLQDAIQKNLKLLKLVRQYEEMIKQAELMEGLAIPEESFVGSLFKNRELKAKRDRAECLTKLSLLLLEVDKCIHSFNLLVFPSGHQYLKDIQSQRESITEMSRDLDPLKIGDVADKCVKLVSYIQLKLDKHYAEITTRDKYWQMGYFSNDYKSTGAFYTWTNADHKFEISQLLLGHPVQFKSDVLEYPERKGAIKYNGTLKLRIAAESKDDEDLKNELLNYLKYFSVTLETGATCHYKLFGNTYTVETGEGLCFGHSMEKLQDDASVSVVENMMLCKLKEHMYSPYTTWTVQLHLVNDRCRDEVSFEKLHEKFADLVQVELEGWGMYIDERIARPKDFEEVTEVYKSLLSDGSEE